MLSRLTRARLLCLGVFVLLASLPLNAVDNSKKLSPEYRHWLNEEVNYIITSEERKHFLALSNDTERQNFMKSFWAARNPEPNSEINTFEEEHYRRLAYANAHFGNVKAQDGWHTDQGMIYILLGEPKQIANYPAARNMRPIQIWFYQSTHSALPSHFYVLFYKRSIGEPYTIYSPYQDGPARLVTGLEGLNDQTRSLKIIRNSLGDEIARTTLSLIPTEPVDLDNYSPSMDSDSMLSTIRGLADNPLEKERLQLNRERENVTASIINTSTPMDVVTMTVRDSGGKEAVSLLARLDIPSASLISSAPINGAAYSMMLRTVVATTDGKAVYEQQDSLQGTLSSMDTESTPTERFAGEARLPLVPGKYVVEVTLTNNQNLQAHRLRRTIEVPMAHPDRLGISDLLAYESRGVVPDAGGRLPFNMAGLRFSPRAVQSVTIHQGEKLPIVFQLWLPQAAGSDPVKTVHVNYLCGSIAIGGKPPIDSDEEVDASNVDAAGNLVTGRTIDTTALQPGTYQLVVRATVPGKPGSASATLAVRVAAPDEPVEQWTAYAPEQTAVQAADDLKRALAAEALGQLSEAELLYTSALKTDPTQTRALIHLAALLNREHKSAELARLGDQPLAASALAPETLMFIVGALRDTGDLTKAIRLLSTQLSLQSPTPPMYELLASMYDSVGDHGHAASLRDKAKQVASPAK